MQNEELKTVIAKDDSQMKLKRLLKEKEMLIDQVKKTKDSMMDSQSNKYDEYVAKLEQENELMQSKL